MNKQRSGSASASRRVLCPVHGQVLFALLAVLALHPAVRAQQSADVQQPGAGAQVHTGSSSGLDADARLQNLLADHQYLRIAAQLDQLPPEKAQFYRGILANRDNDVKKSIALLEPLIDNVTKSGNATEEKLLRKALAEDYLRDGDWPKASAAYAALNARLGAGLTSDEQDEIEMPLKMLPLARNNPPMTVDPCDPFEIQANRNPLGLYDVPVFVDARSHSWMLDPTAPFNLIARSLAKEAGLTVSAEAVTIHTLTGRPIQVHVTVIPRFTIGGQLTLRNMTAFVFEDADYSFPSAGYQIEGILGYAALQALGSITITNGNVIFVRPSKQIASAEKNELLVTGARFFLDGDQIIAALGGSPGSAGASQGQDERMFAIDAAGQQTYLTSRYYDEHSAEFTGQKMEPFTLPGQAKLPSDPAYIAESLPLSVGNTIVHVHYLPVLTQPLGLAARDDLYGVLGIDALDQLQSYTFDYRTMRFSVQPE